VSSEVVARRYAAALADVLIARAETAAVQVELAGWERMINGSAHLQEVFRNPTIPYEQKHKVLSELLQRTKVRPTTANFLQLLLRNQRLTELPQINIRLAQVLDERAGVLGAEVISARPLPEDAITSLKRKLLAQTGKQVRMSFAIDESLIGGLVTRIGSTVYDGSVKAQLERLEESLAGKQMKG
jgi:F-type H+-transporting ATPase subunit delta